MFAIVLLIHAKLMIVSDNGTELNSSAILGEVLHPELGFRTYQIDGLHMGAAPVIRHPSQSNIPQRKREDFWLLKPDIFGERSLYIPNS